MLRHLRTSTPLLFGSLILLIGLFVGEYWGLYAFIPYFDKILHVSGGLAVAWMAMALLQSDIEGLRGWKQVLIIVSVTSLVGVLWEFAEYWSNGIRYTHPLWYHYFHGGDFADTIGDLIADLSGGTAFILGALYKERH
jgi:hypothetical protein